MKNNKYKIAIYFLPLCLIFSSFLSNLIVLTCSIFFLYDSYKHKLYDYYNNIFFKIFLIFFFLINLSAIFNLNIQTLKYSIGYLRFGIFSTLIFYLLKNDKNFIKNFIYIIFLIYTLLAIDSILQIYSGKNFFLQELQKYHSELYYLTSFFGEEKKLGSYFSRMFPLFVMSLILLSENYKSRKINLIFTFCLLIIYFLTFYTTERIAIFFLQIFLIIILLKIENFFQPKKIFIILILVSLVIFFIFNPLIFEKLKSILYQSGVLHPGFNKDNNVIGGYNVDQIYIYSKFYHDQILNCLNIFKDNFMLGIGPKNYKFVTNLGWHPHNFHAQILAELGMLAYTIFLLAFIFFFKESFKLIMSNNYLNSINQIKLILNSSLFVFFLPIPNGDFFNSWLNNILYLTVGFYIFYNEKK